MNLSVLREEFAALGITVTQTQEGNLSAKPRRLLTDTLRERLKAAKEEMQRGAEVSLETAKAEETASQESTPHLLRLVEHERTKPILVRTGPPPILVMVDGTQPKLDPYGINGGEWYGPDIEALPVGVCASCGWTGPLKIEGEESQCAVCWQADQQQDSSGPIFCDTFCEGTTVLLQPRRVDPGGLVACPSCRKRMQSIRLRMAGRTVNEEATSHLDGKEGIA